MSIQAVFNNQAISEVQDIFNEFEEKGHPHTEFTILREMGNESIAYDSKTNEQKEVFKNELRQTLQYLVDQNELAQA